MSLRLLVVLVFVLSWHTSHAASSCKLPKGTSINIGCTYDCGWWNKWRMKSSAALLGYKVKFTDMRTFATQEEALRHVDAVLIPGGADINPDYYTQELPSDVAQQIAQVRHLYNPSREGEARDPFEYGVLRTVQTSPEFANTPVLGICRGMQMLTVSNGIPLYVDIKAELGIKNRYNKFDKVLIPNDDTVMSSLFPKGKLHGFKYHHQGLRLNYYQENADQFPQVRVTGFSHQGRIAESIEITDRPILGIQFHPEKSLPSVKHKIFGWLLKEACLNKTMRGN